MAGIRLLGARVLSSAKLPSWRHSRLAPGVSTPISCGRQLSGERADTIRVCTHKERRNQGRTVASGETRKHVTVERLGR